MTTLKNTLTNVRDSLKYPLIFIALLWVIQIINSVFFNQGLTTLGVLPRTASGLMGIVFAPFLHGSYEHLIGNSFMLLLLSWILCFYDKDLWLRSLIVGGLIGGLITWLIGSFSYHIGASISVFSLWGTILGVAIFHKKPFFIIAAIVLSASYGVSMIYGLIPQTGISFAGHFGGLIAGFICAKKIYANDD